MNTSRILLVTVGVLLLISVVWAAKERDDASPQSDQNAQAEKQAGDREVTPDKQVGEAVIPVTTATAAAAYQIPWESVNGGGNPGTSASYMLNASVGQSTIGYATSTSYEAGIGYWYGANASPGPLCDCPYQSDFDEDGFLTPLDLSAMIDILFAGDPDVQDPDCPYPRADFDCDGFSTPLDLSGLIDHLFAAGPPPCSPCS